MKRENNTGIIIAVTAAAVTFLAIMIAGVVFLLPFVKEKCTDIYVDHKLDEGYKYLSQQDYKPAIAAFNTVVKVDDKRTEAYIGLGDAYSGQKDWVPAANYYSVAIDNIQNGAGTIESASFANGYLAQSYRRPEKGSKNDLSTSSINNHSGNTTIIVNQDLLQVLVEKRNNANDCGREKNESKQDCIMKTAEDSVVVEGSDTNENSTSDDIPAQEGAAPSDDISKADDLSPSEEILIDDETGSSSEADNDQADEEIEGCNAEDSIDEQPDENAEDCTEEQPDENTEDSTDEQPNGNADDSTDDQPDETAEDEFAVNEQNSLKPYIEVIDKLTEEHGEIRMTKSIQEPDDLSIAELNGMCLLTLLDMDGMGEKELFAVYKNDTDTAYNGIIYTIREGEAVAALEIADTAASLDGYDSTVCIHRYNNRDYILVAESDESGFYSISGYIGDKYATVKYSCDVSFNSEETEEELTDPEETDTSTDDEESYNDEEDSEDWDESYDDDDAYNDEESEDWTESEDVDTYEDEDSEDWDDYYNEDAYDVSYIFKKPAFSNCTCRVDPQTHKVINCASTDSDESVTYNYYINDEPVDEETFTNGLADFGLSMSGSNGEDTQYVLAGYKEDIQFQTLSNLNSDTETEIREGMKMS